MPPAAVQRKARGCPAALRAQPTTTEPSAETPQAALSIAAQRAEVLHPTRRRPAKGAALPCGVRSPANHHGAIGGNAKARSNRRPACRGPASHAPPSSERHDACPAAFQPSRPPRSHRRKRPVASLQSPPSVPRSCMPTRRRPAKGTPLPCGVVSGADHHGAIGGNASSPLSMPPGSVPRSCIPAAAVQRKARYSPNTSPPKPAKPL
jgi:hypothetical protein